jgi:GMP synthase (glutamine-hydrolysing)
MKHQAAAQRPSASPVVAILDAGSQFGGLIDRVVRELGFHTALLPLDTAKRDLEAYAAIIISGGPKSVNDPDAYLCATDLFTIDKPVLGVCYGMQLLAKFDGGRVGQSGLREDGPQATVIVPDSALFTGLAENQQVLMSHGDSVQELPPGFRIIARSGELIAGIEHVGRPLYGVQFHPEVFQTEHGVDIYRNFLFGIAGLTPDYTIEEQEQEAIAYIQAAVGQHDVVVFVSGGVDSAVLAALMAKAVDPKQIHAFHVDTGFMRAGESSNVIGALEKAGLEVALLDMSDMFYDATTTIDGSETPPLHDVIDPQVKRKIIGDTFVQVRAKILEDYHLAEESILAQGSLRPDLIESGSQLASSKADTIKTHHNDTEAVRRLRQTDQVVEPLQELYKDQVRALGRRLGLPPELVDRHPFPGPGLAIRIICADQPYRLPDHEQLQSGLDAFLVQHGYEDFQASLLPVRTVGVQGDGRSYKYLAGISGPPDWERLSVLAGLIPNHNHSINRVCYVFGEPFERTKLGITPTRLTKPAIQQLQQADAIVTEELRTYDLMAHVSQLPVVLFPVDFGVAGARSIALRPFMTPDFMTGLAAKPGSDLPMIAIEDIVQRILNEVPGIARVALDLSNKPPATTEWE